MSGSNFLNVEEIILLCSCLFRADSLPAAKFPAFPLWTLPENFIKSTLNPNLYAVVFGLEYYQRIIRSRNPKKNPAAASLFINCLQALLGVLFYNGAFYVFT